MPSLVSRLISLTAADVMTRDPVTLRGTESIASAIETLERHQITGAPVVDVNGKLIGILSLWDVVHRAARHGAASEGSMREPRPGKDAAQSPERARAMRFAKGETVIECMSPTVTGVAPDQLLVEVARKMCIGHWHRAPVVDRDGRVLGIISTMDVLAAMVSMFDELK
jgi:CBS-domain-containing membrane protein